MRTILLHKYELLHKLGSGAEGEVMLAKDLHLERLVAVKRTLDSSALNEKDLLMKLEHPGLPQIYDFFEEHGNCYLVMEYIEGISLKQYLARHSKVPYPQAVEWILQLTDILQYLHNHRPAIIYRDLKPGNIMIRQDGKLKLIDMGAAFHHNYGQNQAKNFCCAGTPGYSPAEQWKSMSANKTCDIYGLGAVFHEMLTGASPHKPPFERAPVREYDKSIPLGLEQVILTATAKRVADRYQTMEQFKSALLSYQKIGKRVHAAWTLKRLMVTTPIMGGIFSFVLPLQQGIPETAFPLPFLKIPFLFFLTALVLQTLLFELGNTKQCLKCQEKNVWLTEKQFIGLLTALFLVLGCTAFGRILTAPPTAAYAGVKEKRLWVELRGEDNRKLLLKQDAVYQAKEKVTFEIPTKDLPIGQSTLQLIAVGRDGEIYTSRIFNVSGQGN